MTAQRFPRGRLIFFVTSNIHKYNEAREVLSECGVAAAMLRVKTAEIQADHIENIAKASALDASRRSCLPIIVEDAGLFIDGLKGFPGPYSKYVFRTIGKEGVLRLLEDCDDRRARFESVVAFCEQGGMIKCFRGTVEGKIAKDTRGSSGFGFDPIFEPDENPNRTFGEMSTEEKNKISHRSRALRKFAEWYKQRS